MNKGLTLIELLISIAIFGILVVGLIGMFVSAMDAQASVLQNQELLNQGSYLTEYMDRSIRMALRDSDVGGPCTGTQNKNYNATGDPLVDRSITFLAYDVAAADYRCKMFYLSSGVVYEKKSMDMTDDSWGTAVPITSSKIKINSFDILVYGDTYDSEQPIVTIAINMQSNSSRRLNPIPSMVFQTSISQRNLNSSE